MKEIFYFSHDLNARNDAKLQKIRMKHGVEGIGIYWCLVEMLYEENGYILLSECERIAYELRIEKDKIIDIVLRYDLFENDKNKFWSNSILDRMKKLEDKSQKARNSALARWNANALQTQCKGNAIKKRKEKKRKEEKSKQLHICTYSLKAKKVLDYFNNKYSRKYTKGGEGFKNILARVKENFTVEDCIDVIEKKSQDDYFINNPKYFNPVTLFRKSNFEKYLNEFDTPIKEIKKNDIVFNNAVEEFLKDDENTKLLGQENIHRGVNET